MRRIISALLALMLVFVCVGCAAEKDEKITETEEKSVTTAEEIQMPDDADKAHVSVACLKGPTGVGMAKLIEDNGTGKTYNDYDFTVAASADEFSAKIVSGEINIASVPTNLAAKLYAKTGGKIRMLAVNTLGVLQIVENGNTISSAADLKGRKIYATGEGSNPEYILRYILEGNRIDPDNMTKMTFVASNDELITALISGNADVAMIAEPAASTVLSKNKNLRVALSMTEEWEKISDSELMMGCVVALDSFVEENEKAVSYFLNEYEKSINYANENVKEAAVLCEKAGIIPSAAIAEKAIPSCNVTFVSGTDMKERIEGYFKVLFSYDAASVGGQVPDDKFYYVQK